MRNKVLLVVVAVMLFGMERAWAVPAFARKYKTACTTCHTIFPKLNPFGEQFRRNGYRFPGIDSDSTKAEPIALGTDEQKKAFPDAVWPAQLSPFPAFAFGFNGQAVFHPDRNSSGGAADNHAVLNADTLIEEGHLWAAGSIDDTITYYSELTFSRSDGVDLETAAVFFNNVFFNQVAQGKLVEADTTLKAMEAALPKNPGVLASYGQLAWMRGDIDSTLAMARQLQSSPSKQTQRTGNNFARRAAATRGRLPTS